MADLDGLLFLEVGRAEDGQRGAVAEAGKAEHLSAQQSAPAAERLRPAVLNDEVGIGGQALDGDVADDVARRGSGRAQRQPDGVAGQVAREQQVALRFDSD